MNIVISVNNNEEVMVLPVVPPDNEINCPQENETKDSISLGKVKLIGLPGLRTFSISSFFPVNKEYKFVKPQSRKDGSEYVRFFEKWRKRRVPFRLVITDKNNEEVLNMPAAVDSFSYSFDKVGDINYSLSMEEYKVLG